MVPHFRTRFSAVLVVLALSAGNVAVCAGWMPTPEARMACCADGGCPMHKATPHRSGVHQPRTQAEADSCCASSERDNSNQSTPTSVFSAPPIAVVPALVLTPSVPTLVLRAGRRIIAPVPAAPFPRHVLLSVFLV